MSADLIKNITLFNIAAHIVKTKVIIFNERPFKNLYKCCIDPDSNYDIKSKTCF